MTKPKATSPLDVIPHSASDLIEALDQHFPMPSASRLLDMDDWYRIRVLAKRDLIEFLKDRLERSKEDELNR